MQRYVVFHDELSNDRQSLPYESSNSFRSFARYRHALLTPRQTCAAPRMKLSATWKTMKSSDLIVHFIGIPKLGPNRLVLPWNTHI